MILKRHDSRLGVVLFFLGKPHLSIFPHFPIHHLPYPPFPPTLCPKRHRNYTLIIFPKTNLAMKKMPHLGHFGAIMGNYIITHIFDYQQHTASSMLHISKYLFSQKWGIPLFTRNTKILSPIIVRPDKGKIS